MPVTIFCNFNFLEFFISMINGPGVNRVDMFNYPHNVCFQAFQPGGNYSWSVNVDGSDGGVWSFTVDNDIYPLNDRSVDTTSYDMVLPTNQRTLEVKNNNIAFIYYIPIFMVFVYIYVKSPSINLIYNAVFAFTF